MKFKSIIRFLFNNLFRLCDKSLPNKLHNTNFNYKILTINHSQYRITEIQFKKKKISWSAAERPPLGSNKWWRFVTAVSSSNVFFLIWQPSLNNKAKVQWLNIYFQSAVWLITEKCVLLKCDFINSPHSSGNLLATTFFFF